MRRFVTRGSAFMSLFDANGFGQTTDASVVAGIIGTPSLSYSEGTYIGNVGSMIRDSVSSAMENGAELIRSVDQTLYNMSVDPMNPPIHR